MLAKDMYRLSSRTVQFNTRIINDFTIRDQLGKYHRDLTIVNDDVRISGMPLNSDSEAEITFVNSAMEYHFQVYDLEMSGRKNKADPVRI